jgi:hypothetical protein
MYQAVVTCDAPVTAKDLVSNKTVLDLFPDILKDFPVVVHAEKRHATLSKY